MGDVVRLREKLVWVCGLCDCTTFRLYNDGTVECALCGSVSDDTDGWVESLKDKPVKEGETDEGTWSVTGIGTVDFARKRVMRMINEWEENGKLAVVAAWDLDGDAKMWADIETQEQKDWMVRKVSEFLDSLKKTAVHDETE